MTEKKKTEEKETNRKDIIGGLILFLLVLAVWYFSWQYIDNSILSEECGLSDTEARGLFGDKFGAINALFSALAFAGIIFTIFLQKRELKLQREEMEETRGEFIKQNETLIQQKFENTFFQLIGVHMENVKSIDLRKTTDKTQIIATGRDCFNNFYKKIGDQINSKETANLPITLQGYLNFYDANKSDLEHYFRHLYHIIKFVESSSIDNKKTYTNFVRAQLSSYELANIFYNGLSTYGYDKMKPLLEKYALLKNLNKSLIFNSQHLESYKKQAYGE